MPEQMMRMAGRGSDGTAKAIGTDDAGRLLKSTDYVQEQKIITEPITIEAGKTVTFPIDLVPLGATIGGIVASGEHKEIFVSITDYIGNTTKPYQFVSVDIENDRFFTDTHLAKGQRLRVAINNRESTDLVIEELNIYNTLQDTVRKRHYLKTHSITHSQFYTYEFEDSGEVTGIKSFVRLRQDTSLFEEVLVYVTHSYETSFSLNVYDRLDGNAVNTLNFDGDEFTGDLGAVTLPSASVDGGTGTKRFPIHLAVDLLKHPVHSLELRIKPDNIQQRKKHNNGNEYRFDVTIMGVYK